MWPSIEDVQYGRLSPLVAPVADDDRTAEGFCSGRRAGARVERTEGGEVRTTDANAQL